mmetsp:Transcript_12219/g.18627  ORF Transcript_12219/g.18627 Transcript_12219/m.18627 type:complete len:83 (+) Transcript_12219:731-979(+)
MELNSDSYSMFQSSLFWQRKVNLFPMASHLERWSRKSPRFPHHQPPVVDYTSSNKEEQTGSHSCFEVLVSSIELELQHLCVP